MSKKQLVYFHDKYHTYNSKTQKFESISKAFKKFKEPFDMNFSTMRSALKELYPDLYNKSKKVYKYYDPLIVNYMLLHLSEEQIKEIRSRAGEFKADWREKGVVGRDNGTIIHTKLEELDIKNGYCRNPFTGNWLKVHPNTKGEGFDNVSKAVDLYNIPDGFHPELLIHSYKYGKAGQSDRVWIETILGVRYAFIDDWKTDKEIEIVPSFFDRNRGYQMLKGELGHLYQTNYWEYAIKISAYAYMLEQFGFKIGGLRFTNTPYDDDLNILAKIPYILPYKNFEAEILLRS